MGTYFKEIFILNVFIQENAFENVACPNVLRTPNTKSRLYVRQRKVPRIFIITPWI